MFNLWNHENAKKDFVKKPNKKKEIYTKYYSKI